MRTTALRTVVLLSLVLLSLACGDSAEASVLEACGYHNLHINMEQVPSDWWNYWENNDHMAYWNYYMDLYRYHDADGSWGHNGDNEFGGFPSNADLNSTWGFNWGSALAMTVWSWYCQCCRLLESDIVFNPAYSWTDNRDFAEDNPASVLYYNSILLHEMGHSWGMKTRNEDYQYDSPTVMHSYNRYAIQDNMTIHADDASIIRRHYDDQTSILSLTNMAVHSKYANASHLSWTNSTTDKATYRRGEAIQVRNVLVENTSNVALPDPHLRLYLSSNRTISTGDTLIVDWHWPGGFCAECINIGTYSTTIPCSLGNGQYYVGAIITYNGYTSDSHGSDNTTRLWDRITVSDSSSLSINNVTLTEGNSGTKAFTFTVTLSTASLCTVTVHYATANGTATAGSDYTAKSGTLTFLPGHPLSQTVTVNVIGDTTVEPNQTFFVNLSSATGATIADSQGLGTITNDDSATLGINNVTLTEGNSGTKAFNFTVTMSNPSSTNVTVHYATANGTALAGSDYTAKSGTLTFTPGQTIKTVTVNVLGDTTVEGNETFVVNLSNASGATIIDSQGVGTITNDDSATLQINDVTREEGNAGTTSFIFTLTMSNPSAANVTVNYATANGTATAGSDYATAGGTLTFTPGQTAKAVTVNVLGDATVEPNETFFVNLSGATGASISDSQGLGTIVNDDGPVLRINDVTKAEGNAGTTSFTFTVTLSLASTGTVTVNYATANGTAVAGSDYTAAEGTLTFTPGQTTKTVTVSVLGNAVVEPNETFFVNLSSATGATIFDGQGLGTILNDDGPVLRINDVRQAEGNAGSSVFDFTVTLSPASGGTVAVNYATANGTAAAGSDYTAKSGTLTLSPGETSKSVKVVALGNTVVEPNETFFVNLSTATGATIFDGQGLGTILNDDGPVLGINDVRLAEGNFGRKAFSFTVSLSPPSTQIVTVQYATANGSAVAGIDYTAKSGTLTFSPSQIFNTVVVDVLGDATVEGTETFFVNLSNAAKASIFDDQGVGYILNDD